MAEKKQKRVVSASTGKDVTKKATTRAAGKGAAPAGSTGGLRFGAIFLWVLAIACEVMAVLVLFGKVSIGTIPALYSMIGFLVIDLIFVIIGSQLWKKANHIKPASEKNPVAFWLWNNLGFIISVIAFLPIIILVLLNKDADKKTKAIESLRSSYSRRLTRSASAHSSAVSTSHTMYVSSVFHATAQAVL